MFGKARSVYFFGIETQVSQEDEKSKGQVASGPFDLHHENRCTLIEHDESSFYKNSLELFLSSSAIDVLV